MPANFTGAERPIDVLNAVLDDFPFLIAEIVYEDEIPYLTIRYDVPTDYVCKYRLDKLLLPIFSWCEELFDRYISEGFVHSEGRDSLVRTLAYNAMSYSLMRLVIYHQTAMFSEIKGEMEYITETILFQLPVTAHSRAHNQASASQSVRKALDKFIKKLAKERREFLAGYLNKLPSLVVPTKEGRPLGSKKPEEVKQREKAEFEGKIEETIRSLFKKEGRVPTKTAVAEALGMGGVNPRGGGDSRLNSFNNKLGRLKIDYDALVQGLDLHE